MSRQNSDNYEYRKLVGQIKILLITLFISRTYTDNSISSYFKRVSKNKSTGLMAQKKVFQSDNGVVE